MRRPYHSSFVGLLLLFVLGACGGEPAVQPSSTPEPPSTEALAATATAVPPSPTFVPSATIPPTTSPLPTTTARPSTPTTAPTDASTAPPPVATATTAPLPIATATTGTTSGEEAVIARIRERYTTINTQQGQYRRIERDLAGYSSEGGTLEGFYDGAALRKVVATYFGELGRVKEEYYVWDEQVFFVFRIEDSYDEPFGEIVTTAEDRYYFDGDQMIRWIDRNGSFIDPAAPEFGTRQTEVRQRAQELLALLSSS